MSIKLLVLRLVSVVGLAVSSASLVDHLQLSPVFCGFDADCGEVTRSSFGSLAGVPLPVFGIVAFGLFLVVTLFPDRPIGRLIGPLAILAGTTGATLLLIQAVVLEQYCRLCLIADACGLCLALIYLIDPRPATGGPGRAGRWLWVGLAVVALAAPLAWGWANPPPPVPEAARAYWIPGKINVVLVTDFDCASCRQTHPALRAALQEYAGRVHFVQLVLPLPQTAHGRPAARAWRCARSQGKGDAMAEALFAAKDLSPAGCEKMAAQLGLDLERFRKCVADSATEAALDEHAWVRESGLKGLPVLWIQEQTLVGVQNRQSIRAALQRAAAQ